MSCHYCGETIDIIEGPEEYVYEWETKKVVHRDCYNKEHGIMSCKCGNTTLVQEAEKVLYCARCGKKYEFDGKHMGKELKQDEP